MVSPSVADKPLPEFSRSAHSVHRLRAPRDSVAVAVLVALGVIAEWDRLTGPSWIGMDTATAFFPWYTFLGEQLRAGHIPVWNAHTFSGAPFAADPESGWMYLPAMLAFTLLPLDQAVRGHLLFQVLLAALSTYALARALGSNALGGVLAATVYAHSGFFEGHNVCCYAYAGVAAWLPLMLLGSDLATRSTAWRERVMWWGLAGLALSQILAVWVGQGAYYAMLVLVSFVTFRRLTFLGRRGRAQLEGVQQHTSGSLDRQFKERTRNAGAVRANVGPSSVAWRFANLTLDTVGVLVFGFTLAAAGLLPRLEYNLVSNLPGGYPDADVSLRATTWSDWGVIAGWDRVLLQPGFEYIGWLALILAVLAPLVARQHSGVPYFAGLAIVVLVLARAEPTPLHAALSFLPGFERIHARSPERALIVFYLAPALLSGATLTWLTLPQRLTHSRALGLALRRPWTHVALALHRGWPHVAAALRPPCTRVARTPRRTRAVQADALRQSQAVLAGALSRRSMVPVSGLGEAIAAQALGALVIAAVALDLHAASTIQAAQSLAGGGDYQFQQVDLAAYFAPSNGARFLDTQAGGEPFRYLGYAGHVFGGPMPYTLRWSDTSIGALLVNNRAFITGHDDVSGYNPVHVARYDTFMAALNGHGQNYHHADIFETGLDSPLLDALNVRYVLMPAVLASDEVAPRFQRALRRVYADETVHIFENQSAFPRAWIVHAATQVAPETAAHALIDPALNLRSTAIIETAPPSLAEPANPARESVLLVARDADRLQVRATAEAPGLLVLSEVYYPAWRAYLDGQPVSTFAVDVALRGVALPPGEHVVEMRYESLALGAGVIISGVAAAVLIGLAILVGATRPSDGSGEVRCKSGAVPQL